MSCHPAIASNPNCTTALHRYGLWFLFTVIVTGITLWEYRNTLHSGFWRDDFEFIEAFSTMGWQEAWSLWKPGAFWCYRPVFLLYWWLGLQVWGENAFAFHLASTLLHVLAILLFAMLVSRFTRQQWMGLAVGALFLLHPSTFAQIPTFNERSIGAVTWISSVSTILAAIFSFATLHAWMSWRQNGKPLSGILIVLFCWLALCSKEDAFALPFVLTACDLIFWPRASRRFLIPIALVAITYVGLNLLTYQLAISAQPNGQNYLHAALAARLKTTLHYALVVWNGVLPMFATAGLGLFLLLGWLLRPQRVALALWAWALIAMLPAPMGVGPHALATRFYYLPAFVVSALLVVGITHLLSGAGRTGTAKTLIRLAGFFWLLATTGNYIPLPSLDFAVLGCLVFGLLGITLLLVREKYIPGFWGSWSVILLIGFQLPSLGLDLPIGSLPLILAILMCLVFRQQWKLAAIPAFIIAYFTAIDPVWYPLIATVALHIAFALHHTGRLPGGFSRFLPCNEGLKPVPS